MHDTLTIVLLGFFLGMRHATDPDHVVAVTTIVARHRSRAGGALIGAVWGLGHALTILAVGAGIVLLGWVIPPRLGLALELVVGIMLIALGFATLSDPGNQESPPATPGGHDHERPRVHAHAHPHGDYVHTHSHGHEPEAHPHAPDQTPLARLDRRFGGLGGYQLARPLVVGIVHGLAGSAAVALLVLASIRDPLWSLLYLLVFGVGTIAGMMLVTAVLAWPFARGESTLPAVHRGLRLAAGGVSLVFGLFLAYRIGVVDGLLSAAPRWTPR
jgi:ABC-type nickel/cobalt efflux system permease component RcnA